ncbi:MAG: PTS transporter subunit EIIC, partial [Erysipelothrix sp.]|nr:PTS transporter subunit EIIC [Erysipelothrix sp.]
MNKHIVNVNLIIDAIGGKDNVRTATHCVTRLRLHLNDESLVDTDLLDSNDLVKGFFFKNNQLQIIIGPGLVDKIYKVFLEQTGVTEATSEEIESIQKESTNKLQQLIKVLADVFIPILPAIVASGLLMGLNNILTNPGIFYAGKSVLDVHQGWVGISDMINVISSTAFAFLPALVGWSAVKKFGGNPVLGIVLGLMLINPTLMPGHAYVRNPQDVQFWKIFGLNIAKIGYQGQVIPVLCAS